MNTIENKMLDCLRELKEVHGVYGIKAEFASGQQEKGGGTMTYSALPESWLR